MADIIFADTTGQYDGQSLNSQPLGATESSVIYLARELVRRNHRVSVFTHCPRRVEVDGVVWRPLIGGAPLGAGDAWQAWEGSFLPPNMPAAVKASIRMHPTAPRTELMEAMRSSRVMLCLGHECEAFCIALAEPRVFPRSLYPSPRCPSGPSMA
jgi:hypothetical protein